MTQSLNQSKLKYFQRKKLFENYLFIGYINKRIIIFSINKLDDNLNYLKIENQRNKITNN